MSDNAILAARADERPNVTSGDRLYVVVAERIQSLIAAQHLAEGDRLPSETELSALLDVSRPTVREALVALEVSGIIEVRRNMGAVVRDLGAALRGGLSRREGGPFEIINCRAMVEPEAARLAAKHRTVAQCDAIERAIERMVIENQAGHQTESGDRDFHIEIARASGNSVLLAIVRDLWRMRQRGVMWPFLQQRMDLSATRSRAVFEHMRVLEAIRSQNGDAAAAAMRDHLETTRGQIEAAMAISGD